MSGMRLDYGHDLYASQKEISLLQAHGESWLVTLNLVQEIFWPGNFAPNLNPNPNSIPNPNFNLESDKPWKTDEI